MNFIQALATTLTNCKKVIVKNKPRIFMFGGIGLSAAGTVTACAATYKHIDRILDVTREKMESADEAENPGKEKAKAVLSCAGEFAKTYAVPVALMAAGYGGIIYANHLHEVKENILSESLTTLGAAYTAYRKRVEEKLGKEEEENVRLGAKDVKETTEVTKDGKTKKTSQVVKEIDKLTGLEASPFAKFFDQSSRCFSDAEDVIARAEYNMEFLKKMEEECNRILRVQGHLLLKDVYEKLDIPITKASLVAGWVYNNPDQVTDDYVDFGLYDKSKWATRRFVNGYEDVVLLDFNCSSNISDLI